MEKSSNHRTIGVSTSHSSLTFAETSIYCGDVLACHANVPMSPP